MGLDMETINADIAPEDDRGTGQKALTNERRAGYILPPFRFHLEKAQSQTKAREIKGKWDRALEHVAIVQ